MSVIVSKRGKQKFGVITKALELAAYTVKICSKRNVNDNGNPRNNDNAYNRNNGFAADCEKLGPFKVAWRTALQNQCHFYKEQSSLPRIFSEVKTMPVTSSAYELVRLLAPA